MAQIDIDKITSFIRDTAAAEVMPRFRKLAHGDIEMKGVNDPVTVADKAAEQALIKLFTDYLPGSVVVGEESCAADAGIMSLFNSDHDVWVIDPIDGTRNFIEGTPEFGTMVALVRNKKTIAAWIHDPNTGDTLTAEQDGGVWLDGKKMSLASHNPSIPVVSIIGARLGRLLSQPEYASRVASLPKFEHGSAAAFDYGRFFTGDKLFANSRACRAAYIVYRESKPWDHVPGLLMLAEAGGYATNLRGEPYNMADCKYGILTAPNYEAWREMRQLIQPAIDVLWPNQLDFAESASRFDLGN